MGRAEKDLFARVDALFQAAIEKDPADRLTWLAEQDEQKSVLEEVRALLDEDAVGSAGLEDIVDSGWRAVAADQPPGLLLGASSQNLMPDADTRDADGDKTITLGTDPVIPTEEIPQSIGPYRILGSLGRGGLATVYLAERKSEFSMPVALKRIRRGMDTDDIVERLRLERQILARLVHANIARIHDGGSDEDGLPYLVMEVIEGERIDLWCRTRKLSTRGRLELFRQACEAVDFAHQNLILHRDLKPSNILVTDDGTLKLLDFGIAKVLVGAPGSASDELDDTGSQQTATGKRLLTPDYASPEQLGGEPLTTASDIYSLGVVLFQLLTGRLPHELSPIQLWSGQRPDAPLASRTTKKERETENPLTPPLDRWSSVAASEIDAILTKALENEPARRYGSARELEDDIARLLDDRPVLARRPTLSYRIFKLARRHRALVTLGALAILSLLIGIIGTSWQAQVAGRERLRAELGQAQAETVVDFLVELFDVSDPYGEARLAGELGELEQPRGQTVTARELLDSAALRISGGLSEDRWRQSRLRRAIARAFFSLSLYDEARNLLEAAATDLAGIEQDSGARLEIERALVLRDLGRLDARQARFELAAIRLLEAEQKLRDLDAKAPMAETLEYLGQLEYWREHGPASEARYSAAIELQLELHGERSLEVARARTGLAKALNIQNRQDEMVGLLQSVLSVRRERLGADHPLVLETQNDLAVALMGHDLEVAARIFTDLIARQRRMLGPDHADLMIALYNLATVLDRLGQRQKATRHLVEAWRVAESSSATETPTASDVLLLQGRLHHLADDLALAASVYERALALRRRLFGDRHTETVTALLRLGRLWADQGEPRAEALLREVLSTSQELEFGEEHWAYLGLGELRLATERFADAEQELRRGLEILGLESGWMTGILELRLAQALAGQLRSDIPGDGASGAERQEHREALNAAAQAETRLKDSSLGPGHEWTIEAAKLRQKLEAI